MNTVVEVFLKSQAGSLQLLSTNFNHLCSLFLNKSLNNNNKAPNQTMISTSFVLVLLPFTNVQSCCYNYDCDGTYSAIDQCYMDATYPEDTNEGFWCVVCTFIYPYFSDSCW